MQRPPIGRDLTQGSIPHHLLSVALPMLVGNLIHTGYSLIDAMWIGRIVGTEAMGAVAVSFPVIFIFIAVASGATIATSILVSQYYGAHNYAQVEKTVGTSFILAMALGIVLSTAGILTVDRILAILGTPVRIMPLASSYLKLTYVGFTIMYLSFLVTSILRGVGDTKTPLLFMAVGVAVNAILDPVLIVGLGPVPRMGLDGAAVASIISSAVALILGFWYLNSKGGVIAFRPWRAGFDTKVALLIAKVGFPSMLQQSAVSLGLAAVMSFVNSFGESAAAAFGAAGRIDSVSFVPAMSIGMAVSTIAGQNLGAGKIDRVKETFRWGVLMTVCLSGFLSIFFLAIPERLLSAFITDPSVISIGKNYLRIVGPSSVMFAVMYVSNGVINGAGHTMTTLVFTLIALWGVRVPAAAILSRTSLGLNGIWISFAIGFGVVMAISLLWYRSGRWQKMVIRARAQPAAAPEIVVGPQPE